MLRLLHRIQLGHTVIGYATSTVRFDEILIGDRIHISIGYGRQARKVVVRRIVEDEHGDGLILMVSDDKGIHRVHVPEHQVQRGASLVSGDR